MRHECTIWRKNSRLRTLGKAFSSGTETVLTVIRNAGLARKCRIDQGLPPCSSHQLSCRTGKHSGYTRGSKLSTDALPDLVLNFSVDVLARQQELKARSRI